MPSLVIYVTAEDQSDLEWLRERCLGAVQEKIEEADGEKRLDSEVHVDWDFED